MKYVLALLALASPLQAQVLRQNSVGVSSGTAFGAFVQKAGDTMTGGLVTTTVTVNGTTLVTSGANVGIGTTSPATKLHMSSGTFLGDGDPGDVPSIKVVPHANQGILIRESDNGNDAINLQADTGKGFMQLYSAGASKIVFQASGNSWLNNTDNFGLGTANGS